MIDRQIEYEIRRDMYELNKIKIKEAFNELKSKFNEFSNYKLICYCLLSIENGFRESFENGDLDYKEAAIKRTAVECFLKMILDTDVTVENFKFNQHEYEEFEENIPNIVLLCGNHLFNQRLSEKRGINKILIESNGDNEYTFKVPIISESIDNQDSYYWFKGKDSNEIQKESYIKNRPTEFIVKKYLNTPNMLSHMEFKKLLSLEKIDFELYNLCKGNVKVDINKMGMRFSSNLIKDEEQLLGVLGAFMYLSKISMFNDSIKDITGNATYKIPMIYSKDSLISIIQKFLNITNDETSNIIEYLGMKSGLIGGINEYPLVILDNNVLWIPSSFIMNDFQFSIVNGHYEKNIKINMRDKTVAQSVVDDISNMCSQYRNIVIATNKEYFDKNNKYNNKDLKSDIDVALYDRVNNCVLIIECKWKENVFLKGEKYDQICDAVNKIYKNQLNKHKYFLELDMGNLDFIFSNNEGVAKRQYFPQIAYIFIDKRIQLHYDGQHAISTFNFLKILKDNSFNNILSLDKVISYINTLNTEIGYKENELISIIKLDGRVIKNNIFTLKY